MILAVCMAVIIRCLHTFDHSVSKQNLGDAAIYKYKYLTQLLLPGSMSLQAELRRYRPSSHFVIALCVFLIITFGGGVLLGSKKDLKYSTGLFQNSLVCF